MCPYKYYHIMRQSKDKKPWRYQPELLIRTPNTALFLTKNVFYEAGIVFVFFKQPFSAISLGILNLG